MSRKKFIESLGATCKNWYWSWSFINEKEKTIIFGAWEHRSDGNISLILDEKWQTDNKGNKTKGYPQSLEHIKLIETGGYTLKTFGMIASEGTIDANGPPKIESFSKTLTTKTLNRVGNSWYASDNVLPNQLPEEISEGAKYVEGSANTITVNAYERNPKAREACIKHFGAICCVCKFDFQTTYGDIGAGYIHVHHIVSLSEIKQAYVIDPIKDLRPVCPNCHAMIHRTQPALQIDQLITHLARVKNA